MARLCNGMHSLVQQTMENSGVRDRTNESNKEMIAEMLYCKDARSATRSVRKELSLRMAPSPQVNIWVSRTCLKARRNSSVLL